MTEVIEALTEGDVYRWSYRDPATDNRPWGSYHCCSRIAVVERGRLRDTYWYGNDGKSFGVDDLPNLELKRLANLSELVPAKEYEAEYYDDADIVDLNHANSTRDNFYLRKGAKRSPDKMMATAQQRLAEAESDFSTAGRRIDALSEIIRKLDAGQIVLYIPSWR